MLSKYTFLAPNLIRVSGEGAADYAHLITSAFPSPPWILRLSHWLEENRWIGLNKIFLSTNIAHSANTSLIPQYIV